MNFAEHCLFHNVILPEDITPGRWMSAACADEPRKKKGRFILDPDGRAGMVFDWRTGEHHAWRANGSGPETLPRPTVDHQARRAAEKARYEVASRAAGLYYDRADPLTGPLPYLIGKELGVEGCAQIRCTPTNELVIPMVIRGRFASVQRILPDGSKLFWPGAPTAGAAFRIDRRNSTVTLLCEGVATGLLLFQAVTEASVVVTFSASNLARVCRSCRPCGLVAVCADNDHETAERIGRNPGLEAAQEAVALTGAGLAVPDCRGSDWLDLFQERMQTLREDNSLSRWKKRPTDIRRSALAEIRLAVMTAAKFIPWPERI